jgi:hypothetical protein
MYGQGQYGQGQFDYSTGGYAGGRDYYAGGHYYAGGDDYAGGDHYAGGDDYAGGDYYAGGDDHAYPSDDLSFLRRMSEKQSGARDTFVEACNKAARQYGRYPEWSRRCPPLTGRTTKQQYLAILEDVLRHSNQSASRAPPPPHRTASQSHSYPRQPQQSWSSGYSSSGSSSSGSSHASPLASHASPNHAPYVPDDVAEMTEKLNALRLANPGAFSRAAQLVGGRASGNANNAHPKPAPRPARSASGNAHNAHPKPAPRPAGSASGNPGGAATAGAVQAGGGRGSRRSRRPSGRQTSTGA